jgi:hypothetical protein
MANNFSTRILTLSGQIITATPSSLLVNGLAIQGGSSTASGAVYTTGDQTISGNKTFTGVSSFNSGAFSNRPTVNGTGVLLSGETSFFQGQIFLPTGLNSYANIGKLTSLNAAFSLGVSASTAEAGFSVSKFYNINTKYPLSPAAIWQEVLPSFNSGPYPDAIPAKDFCFDISGSGNSIDFRLRNKVGTNAPALVNVNIFNYIGSDYTGLNLQAKNTIFTRNTGSGIDSTSYGVISYQGTTYVSGYFLSGLTVSGNGLNVFGPTALSGNANINGALTVSGHFSANTKSFLIDHPTIPGKKLQYGVAEGPEHSVFIRGKLINDNFISFPHYWSGLVDLSSITVSLTPIGTFQNLYVNDVNISGVKVVSDALDTNYYYHVFAERKDVPKLEVEV